MPGYQKCAHKLAANGNLQTLDNRNANIFKTGEIYGLPGSVRIFLYKRATKKTDYFPAIQPVFQRACFHNGE